jgi:NADH-quinone oxidoreductase subunit A
MVVIKKMYISVLAPVVAFVVFLIIGYLLYRLGGAICIKPKPEGGKLESYACGENIPGAKLQQTYALFYIAFFFTILHVTALVIVLMPGGNIALIGIGYLIVMLISVAVLLLR